MSHIKILKSHEISHFDVPKLLTPEERIQLFTLETGSKKIDDFTKNDSLVGYLLLKGYFISNNRFFKPRSFQKEDIKFCCDRYSINSEKYLANKDWYKESTIRLHKSDILDYFNFKPFQSQRTEVFNEAIQLVRKAIRPKKVLLSLIRYLYENRIEIPEYGVLNGLITDALNLLEESITTELMGLLSEKDKELLDEFITMTVHPGDASTHNPYLLTTLKRPNQDTSPNKIKDSIQEFKIVADMFKRFEPILGDFSISQALVNYYAGCVIIA